MFKRAIGACLRALRGSTYQESKERLEAAAGKAKNLSQTSEFEAVSWMHASGDTPEVALQRFERESMMPDNDLEERLFEAIRTHLRRWKAQLMPSTAAEGTAVFDAAVRQSPVL